MENKTREKVVYQEPPTKDKQERKRPTKMVEKRTWYLRNATFRTGEKLASQFLYLKPYNYIIYIIYIYLGWNMSQHWKNPQIGARPYVK